MLDGSMICVTIENRLVSAQDIYSYPSTPRLHGVRTHNALARLDEVIDNLEDFHIFSLCLPFQKNNEKYLF
jgi:hypothetical protein